MARCFSRYPLSQIIGTHAKKITVSSFASGVAGGIVGIDQMKKLDNLVIHRRLLELLRVAVDIIEMSAKTDS